MANRHFNRKLSDNKCGIKVEGAALHLLLCEKMTVAGRQERALPGRSGAKDKILKAVNHPAFGNMEDVVTSLLLVKRTWTLKGTIEKILFPSVLKS